jgi:hypothetical protein
MAFSLNFAALEASLLADALPKRARTDGAPSKIGPQRKPRSSDAESDASPILRAYAMTYPRSLVSANRGVATSGVPASAAAGVRARAHAAALRAESLRCPVRATPQRVSACVRANAEADDALRRFHESAAMPNASVDGALRDVVESSLAAEAVCAVDDWEKAE